MLVSECFFGSFSRSVILPENLAFNKIRATVEQNIIMVHIPKLSFFSKTIKVEK
jgi:HSP20 family molecular chaperone IbpA